MIDEEDEDDHDDDGPFDDRAKIKKTIDALPFPDIPIDPPDDPGGNSVKEKEKKDRNIESDEGRYRIDEAIRELAEDQL